MSDKKIYRFYGREPVSLLLHYGVAFALGVLLFLGISKAILAYNEEVIRYWTLFLIILRLCVGLSSYIMKNILKKLAAHFWRVELGSERVSFTFKDKHWCFYLDEIIYVNIRGEDFNFHIHIITKDDSLIVETLFNQDQYLAETTNNYTLYRFLNAFIDLLQNSNLKKRRKLMLPITTSSKVEVTYKRKKKH